jgi:hypothetical protein
MNSRPLAAKVPHVDGHTNVQAEMTEANSCFWQFGGHHYQSFVPFSQ